MKVQKLTQLALFAAMSMILSYIEVLFPFQMGIPGAKLGLANLVVLFVLYLYGIKEACYINFIRIILMGLLFGNLYSIMYSISGACVSMIFMVILKRFRGFSVVGVSIIGSVGHNLGQIIIAFIITTTSGVLFYVPFLMIVGMVSGLVIGLLVRLLLPVLKGLVNREGVL